MRRLLRRLVVGLLAAVLVLLLQLPQRAARSAGLLAPGRLPPPASCRAPCAQTTVTVATLNVLCSFCGKEGYDGWPARAPHLRALLDGVSADIVALQEVSRRAHAEAILGPGYVIVAPRGYTDALIGYRQARFAEESSGAWWLSPTPDIPLSWGWQRLAFPRVATWAVLRERTSGQPITVVTTHLDNNAPNKEGGASLLGTRLPPLADVGPLVFLGDFNTRAREERFTRLRGDLVEVESIAESMEQHGTLEGVPHTRRELSPRHRIDHILVGGPQGVTVEGWQHLAPVYGDPQRRPSDHPAITATITIPKGSL